MLVAAAVCPHPPLLVPELAGGAAGELDALRAACAAALTALDAARPDRVVVVGTGPETVDLPDGGAGSFAPYGVGVTVRLGTGSARLPESLAVGAWLLGRTPVGAPVSAFAVAADAAPGDCLAAGAGLAARDERVALLVMGDGSACRTEKAPGYLDPRAEAYDAAVAAALRDADVRTLAGLDAQLSSELWVAGRAAWQVLAGAADGTAPATVPAGRLLYEDAPYGVGYLVSVWS